MSIEKEYIDVSIEPGKTAYDAVAKYIYRYWDHYSFSDVILSLKLSYDNVDWRSFKTIALFDAGDIKPEFVNDWWEGERFIRLYGIESIDFLDISGGLYPD